MVGGAVRRDAAQLRSCQRLLQATPRRGRRDRSGNRNLKARRVRTDMPVALSKLDGLNLSILNFSIHISDLAALARGPCSEMVIVAPEFEEIAGPSNPKCGSDDRYCAECSSIPKVRIATRPGHESGQRRWRK